jgi:D-alanyl-D-alanine carboxypeptidase
MGWIRFGLRSGFFFLVLAGVAAPLAMTTNAAEERHHMDVAAQRVHDSGLVDRVYATPSSPAAALAAVRIAAQLPEAQSTIIVMTPEPGAVVTSTKPAVVTSTNPTPTKAESANPEPEALKPAKQQAHASGGWLVQIGAFDGEAEARQHLSEAQLNASTALAAADPFTERVQRGDKVLYRARFAGFDKETAEIACKQLKRGHFECMALKN